MKFYLKFKSYHSRKCICRCRLQKWRQSCLGLLMLNYYYDVLSHLMDGFWFHHLNQNSTKWIHGVFFFHLNIGSTYSLVWLMMSAPWSRLYWIFIYGDVPCSLAWSQWAFALHEHHNGRDGVSSHQSHHCLLNRLFRHRSKKTSKLRVTGLCTGNSPVTGEFPVQMASNAENVSIWWRHHGIISSCQWKRNPNNWYPIRLTPHDMLPLFATRISAFTGGF